VSLVRLKNPFVGSRLQVVANASVPLDTNASNAERLGALSRALADSQWQDAEAYVVVSDRLVRYFIAERPMGARNAEEVRLAAQLRFEDVFGEAGDHWEIRVDMPPFAVRQLACALRKDFVAGIVCACIDARLRLASIAPFAISEYNRWHTEFKPKGSWFGVLDRHGLWIGRQSRDGWESANQCAADGDIDEAFLRIFAQESLRASSNGASSTSSTVWLAGHLGEPVRKRLLSSSSRVLGAAVFPGQSTEWSACYRVALSSVWPACA
jgi:hypothetical protein